MAGERIVVAGGTGFIGRALVGELAAAGYEVVVLTRGPAGALPAGVRTEAWDGRTPGPWAARIDGALAVVNLTGESLARGRWTKAKKGRILDSRLGPGAALVEAVRRAALRPRVFVQASAVGFYGSPGEAEVDEACPPGAGFLAGVVRRWEDSTREVEALGTRRVVVRSGLVIGPGGGVWPSLARPFRFFAGGPIGRGRQWLSWIALEDEVRAIRFLVERPGLAGPFDLTAPRPVREIELCRAIAKVLGRPCWLPVPVPLLGLLFGEKSRETLLVSQRVLPRRLLEAGFEFRHPDAAGAAAAAVRSGSRGEWDAG